MQQNKIPEVQLRLFCLLILSFDPKPEDIFPLFFFFFFDKYWEGHLHPPAVKDHH